VHATCWLGAALVNVFSRRAKKSRAVSDPIITGGGFDRRFKYGMLSHATEDHGEHSPRKDTDEHGLTQATEKHG
jgi:hypothetical protein